MYPKTKENSETKREYFTIIKHIVELKKIF